LTALEQNDFCKGVRKEQVEIRRYDKHLEITRFWICLLFGGGS
jgi:hypothetical protein